jgi:iron complex outermembrane recepter protein
MGNSGGAARTPKSASSNRSTQARSIGLAVVMWVTLEVWRPVLAAEQSFDIQTQDAVAALAEFGRQSGSEILFAYDAVKGRQTRPVVGRFEPPEALRRMIEGTELRASRDRRSLRHRMRLLRGPGSGPAGGARLRAATLVSACGRSRACSPRRQAPSDPRNSLFGANTGRLESVLVTGSRIPRDALSAPMPLVAIDRAQIADSGVENIADAIVQLPSVSVGVNLANSRQFVVGAGTNLISLRGLGVDRTLVLVDGRRQVSGSPSSAAVDLNTIPADLVERVEVVTGGTSAVYGADHRQLQR